MATRTKGKEEASTGKKGVKSGKKVDPGILDTGSSRKNDFEIIERHWQEIPLEERGLMFGSGELVVDDMIADNVRCRVAKRLRKMYPDEK